jgi:hypothetical protein
LHGSESAVIKPRSKFDRTLARIEQQVIWELSPQAPRDNMADADRMRSLAFEALEIGALTDATPAQRLRAISVAKDCFVAACQVRTTTVIDRTYAALQRIEVSEAIAALPVAEAEDVVSSEDETARMVAETHEMMRQLLAATSGQNGNARPGLVMIRGGVR